MKQYQIFAIISMVFAGLTSVIAKAGLKNVSSDTGLAVRTIFVFVFVWLNIFLSNNMKDFSNLTKKDVLLLGISALTTSLSWIFYYKAIKVGNVSEVALIDKASILMTIILSVIFLNEQFTWKMALGSCLIIGGLLVLTLK
ncbi:MULTISPECIES: EamA family transporter [Weeksellaceae]|jgi:transporter family protein|uniref:EamA family transporter n=1 Tax=Weeksellaceae TaxID=2762318 RepID=UPI001BCC8523|nr:MULTISPECIES: EamA family transporter [Weeksellaceae]UBB89262.1 EamA family transporter [Candidatus Kaistella beijingensis]